MPQNDARPSALQAPIQTVATSAPFPSVPGSALQRAGAALAGAVLYLLLIDAAVETVLAGSAERWLVAGTVAGYLVVSVLLRRLSASFRASGSLVVLAGLLAYSAWRAGGVTTGVVILRQAPSVVLAALTGLAVLLGAWSLVRRPYLPAVLKALAALLALYALAAIGWGVVAATPFAALVHGQSAWMRLPFWLQGAFVGGLVLLPLGILVQAAAAVAGAPGTRRPSQALLAVASGLALAVVVGAFAPRGAAVRLPVPGPPGTSGPGLRQLTVASLQLPVPRAFDLSHVTPEHFAAALGRDRTRIFEFVRDQVAYEPYAGCLRGPRGTLLAMAGNSVDRAALLASLLQQSGERVRYARGRLPDDRSRELVASMWLERPPLAALASPEVPPEVKAVAERLVAGVKREGGVLRDVLKKAGLPAAGDPVSPESLVTEAADHYWVQSMRDGAWSDLDPSFADAQPGKAFAQASETFDALPEALFHRVNIRVRLEEYTGDAASSREILQYSATAADLAGVDLLLAHQAEQGTSPAASPPLGGLSSGSQAKAEPGQVKPSLRVHGQQIVGQPFRLKPPPAAAAGAGFDGLLGGAEGGAVSAPIATAEWIELDFLAPGGRRETVAREIFDRVGAARRAAAETVRASEVAAGGWPASTEAFTAGVYDLFFTSGSIHPAHLENLAPAAVPAAREPLDVQAGLQRMNVTFAATSDGLLARAANAQGVVCRMFLDSPRVSIAEFSMKNGAPRLSLDLRRDQVRALVTGFRREQIFNAQVSRGVVEGTLERVLVDYFAASLDKKPLPWAPAFSTSLVFERAREAGSPTDVLSKPGAVPGTDPPADARARIDKALSAGLVVVTPRSPVAVAGAPRLAWWEVDPRSGATTAVTDEGLHQAIVETGVLREKDGTITVWTGVRGTEMAKASNFANWQQAYRFLQAMTKAIKAMEGVEMAEVVVIL